MNAYIAHFSWQSQRLEQTTDNRLTCVAIAEAVDEAVDRLYGLLEQHARDDVFDVGCDIYLDDLSEIDASKPCATLVYVSISTAPKPSVGISGYLGDELVAHFGGEEVPDCLGPDGEPGSFEPKPFAVIRSGGSVDRP